MPPDSFVIFLDENHCNNRKLLAVLQDAGVPVVRHLELFSAGTPDEVWLPSVGRNGWALLTTDSRIRYRTNEKRAVKEHRVRMFYFSTNQLSGQQMAAAIEKALTAMRRIVGRVPPPFCAAITRSGAVHVRETFSGESPFGEDQP